MVTAFVVFTIFSGFASLLGFAFIFFGVVTIKYKILCAIGFLLAGVWAGYVLIVPNSTTEKNVTSKIAYYEYPSVERRSEILMIQRGSFALSGVGPMAIEFFLPFRDPPEIEIINFMGYNSGEVPLVKRVSAHQFEVSLLHLLERGFPQAGQNRIFKWVARGIPLEEHSQK